MRGAAGAMFRGRVSSWNLRDLHMVDTLVSLASHLARVSADDDVRIYEELLHQGEPEEWETFPAGI